MATVAGPVRCGAGQKKLSTERRLGEWVMGNEHLLLRRGVMRIVRACGAAGCWLQRLLERRAKQTPLHVSRTSVRSASCA